MKIISRGQLPEEKVHRLTCQNCKTVFEVTQGECKLVSTGYNENAYSHDCPVCQRACYVLGGSGYGYFDR